MDFGDTEDTVTLKAIQDFEKLVGKHQAIVASSSFWGLGTFPDANVRIISDYGAVPLIYWSPWGPPYEQGPHVDPGNYSLSRIAEGQLDPYIDKWAAAARAYGKPLLVSFACEMNSNWFPWAGRTNGADAHSPDGGGFAGPEMYKRAYRHAVDRIRADGAANISWVFQPNNTSHPNRKWNAMAQYYPGPNYVDWLSMSAYGQITPGSGAGDGDWDDWAEVMDKQYKTLAALDPDKPIMLAEWGVGEFPLGGSKADFIRAAFAAMNGGMYPRLKAAIFWHERWQNKDESWSNLRVQSSPGSLKAYRQGVANPFWLGEPEF
jgi:beta-mannanase